MKKLLVYTFVLGLLYSCHSNSQSISYIERIKSKRKETHQNFLSKEKSPLTEEDRLNFMGLNYYSIDSNYKVEAKFTRTPDEEPFEMQTSTDRLPIYIKYGFATFQMEEKRCTLNLYQSQEHPTNDEGEPYLFIPFGDNTSAIETYGGGRFMDVKLPENETIIIDFNLCYNPYCAYNNRYSCPIPPRENLLEVSIKAGEKIFKEHH